MRKAPPDFFDFDRSERRGIFAVLIIMVVGMLINYTYPKVTYLIRRDYKWAPYLKKHEAELKERNKKLQDERYAEKEAIRQRQTQNESSSVYGVTTEDVPVVPIEERDAAGQRIYKKPRKPFEVNTANLSDWLETGLSEKQVEVIQKFQSKGGLFFEEADLREVYALDSSFFDKVAGSLMYDSARVLYIRTLPKVALNKADTALLKTVYGIGNYTAAQIVKYRERLGGFVHIDQLKEVKGVREKQFVNMKEQLTIDKREIEKINLNSCTFKELLHHPYIDYHRTKLIFEKKDQLKRQLTAQDVKSINFGDSEFLIRIQPYLEY